MQKLFQDEMAAAEQANGAASSQQQSIVRMTRSGLAIPYTEIPAPRLLRDYAGLVETAFTCIPDPTASLEQLQQQQQQEQQQQWESSPPSSFERQTATYKGLTATYHRGQTSAFEEQRVTYGWPTTTTSEAQTGSYTSEAATYEWPTSTSEGQTATYTSETATNEAQTITSEGQTATYTSQTASYEDQSTSVSTHHSQTRPQQLTWLTDITTQDSAIGTVDNASINTSASYQSDAGSLLSLRPYPSPLAIRRDTFNLPSPSLSPEEETQPFTGPEILIKPLFPTAKTYFVLALCSTILCCLPVGVLALISSQQARRHSQEREVERAMLASKKARYRSLLAMAVGCVVWTVVAVTLTVVLVLKFVS